MKNIAIAFLLSAIGVNTLAANQVFYRYGSANIQTTRGNELFTDVQGANGLNNNDTGTSIGAGLDLKLFNCPLIKNAEFYGQIFLNYTKYSEEKVASAAHVLVLSDTAKKEVNVSELAITIAPKYKFNFGKIKPWIIPIGLSFLVNSPPSNTSNYLDIGFSPRCRCRI